MSLTAGSLLSPDWPAPATVQACVTSRLGGVSQAPFASLNLGDHVGDAPSAVAENRRRLSTLCAIKPAWLRQVHGIDVVHANPALQAEADASWSETPGVACTVMTADCLPVLFTNRAGTRVAAAHAGWRGLANGVLEATVASLNTAPEEVLVWLGPAIGSAAFEVGEEVRDAFTCRQPATSAAFTPGAMPGKFMADIYALARLRLAAIGVTAVYGGGLCTVTDERWFSYRRATHTGRFASLVWLKP